MKVQPKGPIGLYNPLFEHDACGTGFVANISGQRSHRVLSAALEAVANLTHRGAVDADAKSGDGAGVLSQVPTKLLRREVEKQGHRLGNPKDLAVAVLFLPQDKQKNASYRQTIEAVVNKSGLHLLGWRPVPTDPSVLGEKALATLPDIQHLLLGRPNSIAEKDYERVLYRTRKEIEQRICKGAIDDFYVPSMSHCTIAYKGLFVAPQLRGFYKDLSNPDFETALALFHQRYSTNTFPNWQLAQPFRMLGHNGEINTLQGNRTWMRAREADLACAAWKPEETEFFKPTVQAGGSDSASLDNVLELLVMSGRDVLHAMMMLVPEAWENMPNMPADRRAFYQYHASLTEPWDGPAALAFTDGVTIAAALDRNGLRPARYKVSKDGFIVMGSEVGVVAMPDEEIAVKGRLGPGHMIAVDTAKGALLTNDDIKAMVSSRRPYALWLKEQSVELPKLGPGTDGHHLDSQDLARRQIAFGCTSEELQFVTKPMMVDAKEPIGSMGDDTPLAVLTDKPRLLYGYFKQRFAQVTNPPIDPLREQIVMSLDVFLGARKSLLQETPEHCALVHVASPLLTDPELESLVAMERPHVSVATLPCLFPVAHGHGPAGLKEGLLRLCREADAAVDNGKSILVLSDSGVNKDEAAIPMILAVGAVHQHLIRSGRRMRCSIVADTGEACEVHHFGTLLGFGANAFHPYLAFHTVRHIVNTDEIQELDVEKALVNYKKSVDDGILKIMSKMGISTLSGYTGAQIFEAVGLNDEVIDLCFAGTPSSVGGIGFQEIAEEVLKLHHEAFDSEEVPELADWGFYRYRKQGEYHAFNPLVIKAMHSYVRSGRPEDYKAYAKLVEGREPMLLRDLMRIKSDQQPIPLEEVEPVTTITKRFATAGMSLGALSPEAHETLAIAMNRIGGKSNTGEGGEDPRRYHHQNSDNANSNIKQVASGRFGVTIEYLVSAEAIEIKMAQGSKPGEGGQLPGHKVAEHIARLRRAVPGIPLISPPPHHDIYSIEDLAQLIYDLKQANPKAKIIVKLVSEAGVGTIAAGVAKAYADVVMISGHDGGTGASPLSSIKNAGTPWELGLSETQQVLMLNELRDRVTVKVDGGFKTGRDVVIGALMGADQYGFGTAAVVAEGCLMARQCHLNTCPVGVATQREDLRAKFPGKSEHVVNYFLGVAQQVREILASMGYRSLQDIIGRVDLLQQVKESTNPRAKYVTLDRALLDVDPERQLPRRCMKDRNDRPGDAPLDLKLIQAAAKAIETQGAAPYRGAYVIHNHNRAVGTRLSSDIASRYGDAGLPDGSIDLTFRGSAGQSFGAFLVNGVRLRLLGEANDYVGKGMAGGDIIVRPPENASFKAEKNVIAGNTVLYGATGGRLFVRGRAGERFAVRNSGSVAVVEGAGDHCCEYMTGGTVVVLGHTGRNFGAGMSHGLAYVLDETGDFEQRYNREMVYLERVTSPEDAAALRDLIRTHQDLTGSEKATKVLSDWSHYLPLFRKVVPFPPTSKAGGKGVVAMVGRAGGKDLREERRAAIQAGKTGLGKPNA